jgi:16S rRNA (cytosine1402-N4)-methyltransferase
VFHEPVLLKEAVELLVRNPAGVYVDGTLGGGGHAEALLERLEHPGRLIGLDWDRDALQHAAARLERFGKRVILQEANFKNLGQTLQSLQIKKIDGLLLDLGVSSHQIDTAERGFSFSANGKLDMRMSREQTFSSYDIINTYSERELSELFKKFGEERRHRAVAAAIVKRRMRSPIATTAELTATVSAVLRYEQRVKSLARIFQALRIAVNDELENLRGALSESLKLIAAGGRLVVISYHSLEDRIVKDFFKNESSRCICPPELPQCVCSRPGRLKIITKRPIRPAQPEVQRNPRGRSARLRAAEIL